MRVFEELRADTAAEVAAWWPEFWRWARDRPAHSTDEALLAPLVGAGLTERARRPRHSISDDAGAAARAREAGRVLAYTRTLQVPFPASVDPQMLALVPPPALVVGGQHFAQGATGGRRVIQLAAPTFGTTPADTARIATAVLTARAVAANVRPSPSIGQRRAQVEADALERYADELEPRLAGSTRPWLEAIAPYLAAEPKPQPARIPARIPMRLRR